METKTIGIEEKDASIFNEEKMVVGNFIGDINRVVKNAPISNVEHDLEIDYAEPSYLLLDGKFRKLKSVTVTIHHVEVPTQNIIIDFPKEYPYELIEHTNDKTYPVSKNGIIQIRESDT